MGAETTLRGGPGQSSLTSNMFEASDGDALGFVARQLILASWGNLFAEPVSRSEPRRQGGFVSFAAQSKGRAGGRDSPRAVGVGEGGDQVEDRAHDGLVYET